MTFTLPDVALGAVVAALVAAFVSLAGLIISKEQKTSEFRQAWIDALRGESALLVAQFLKHSDARAFGGHPTSEQPAAAALSYRASAAAVRLRLNVEELPSKEVFKRLDDMDRLIATGDFDQLKSADAADGFVASVQPILKTEWDRVKRGEFWFRSAKLAFGLLIAAAISLLIASYLRH